MRGSSDKHAELQEIIKEFRDDEMHHHDIGIENDAEKVVPQVCHTEFFPFQKARGNVVWHPLSLKAIHPASIESFASV